MRISRVKVVGIIASMFLAACSGSDEKETSELDVTTEEGAKPDGGEGDADAPVSEEAAPQPEEAPVAEAAPAEPAPAAAQPAPQSEPAPKVEVNKSRVVRFVKAKEAIVRGGASDQAPEKGRLKKGDTVVVEEQGDWSKINDDSFIKSTELSKKPVKREREKASWKK